MNFLDLFTHQHIHDVLKKTFSYSDESEILFSATQCSNNENFTILSITGNGTKQTYYLVKIPKIVGTQKKQLQNSTVVSPVFVIENKNKECYGAFNSQHGIENCVPPMRNSTESLKIILHDLADHQAQNFADSEFEKPIEYNLKVIAGTVTFLDFFKDLDRTATQQSVENLQLAINKLLSGSDLLVKSIWYPCAKNVYINQNNNKSVFLNISSEAIVPPAYDALLYIFSLSNEKFRQKHLEDLMLYYFESLVKSLQKLQSNLADKITKFYREHQVKVLLPIIKFKVASYLLKLENSQEFQEILANIFYFLKYPLINQEDVYEAIKNKIGGSHYEFLDYSLVALSEKNGHLGEYFHLDISIKTQNKKQELQLFAKFMNSSIDFVKAIVESGPAKKEEFFYQTLIPLYSKYGLDSLLDFAPRCYLFKTNWLVVLDDLCRQGYKALKPNIPLNYEGLKASITNLAKFHSCTIILEEMMSKESGKLVRLGEVYEGYFEETYFIYKDNHHLKLFFDNNLESFYYILEKFPEITKKLNASPEELRARVKKVFFSAFSKVTKSDTIRNVINHGDMYVANILFKFGKDKLITEGLLVDFQLLRYVTPSYDLLFFLYENSTKETRDKYLKVLIEEYYLCVSENLRKFSVDPEIVFPKKDFDENINFMTSACIVAAFMYGHVVHIDPHFREEIFEDQEKFNYYFNTHKNELVEVSWKSDQYRNILKGFVEDLVDIIKKEF